MAPGVEGGEEMETESANLKEKRRAGWINSADPFSWTGAYKRAET